MSFFDQAYDEMSWQEICYRLPSELAISALQRRVTNLDTLKMFFDNAGNQPGTIKQLKDHVNSIISSATLDDIFAMFDAKYHPVLFNWLTQDNIDRIKTYDPAKLSLKFLFNITDSKDQAGLQSIMGKILAEPEFSSSNLSAVLRKADDKCLAILLDTITKDVRPEVRAHILSISGLSNKEMVSDLQKVIGLKAFAKCTSDRPLSSINVLNMNAFGNLRPLERIVALERYLGYFPQYSKVKAFETEPSDEEFQMILFAGCLEYNDRVNKLHELYKRITKEDPPAEDSNDEEVP
jgi:hypothetical protein